MPYPCVETFARIQKNAKALRYGPPPPVLDAPPVSTRIVEEILARTGGSQLVATATPTFTRTNATCRVANGSLAAETHLGGNRLLSRVALDGREFGAWGFMIHHDRNGVRHWTSPTRVTAADWEPAANDGGRLVVTAEARGNGIAYRVKEAFTFTPGLPAFRADVLEIANIGKDFSPFATFAGEEESSAAKPVPNLWRAPKTAVWLAKDGRFWGVTTDSERIGAMNFHVEPKRSVHPDFAVVSPLAGPLQPGSVYVPTPDDRLRAWSIVGLGGASEWRRISSGQ